MTWSLSAVFRKYAGWCPMAAAAQKNTGGEKPAVPQAHSDDPGPVTRRAVLFCRLTYAVVVLAWIVAMAALPYLPETIPVHWNMYGEADGFTGRLAGAFGLPAIMTLTLFLLHILPRFDAMRVTFDDSRDIYAIITFAVVSLLLGVEVTTLLSSSGMNLPMGTAFPVLLGFFFIVVGGLMPHLRRNTTAGIRLPWTIRSERVWDETHQHGGPVFVIAGILMVLTGALAGAWGMPISLGIVLAATVYVTVWSYRRSQSISDNTVRAQDP
jgi:uncharacterized membrane protein